VRYVSDRALRPERLSRGFPWRRTREFRGCRLVYRPRGYTTRATPERAKTNPVPIQSVSAPAVSRMPCHALAGPKCHRRIFPNGVPIRQEAAANISATSDIRRSTAKNRVLSGTQVSGKQTQFQLKSTRVLLLPSLKLLHEEWKPYGASATSWPARFLKLVGDIAAGGGVGSGL